MTQTSESSTFQSICAAVVVFTLLCSTRADDPADPGLGHMCSQEGGAVVQCEEALMEQKGDVLEIVQQDVQVEKILDHAPQIFEIEEAAGIQTILTIDEGLPLDVSQVAQKVASQIGEVL